jgi:hypothetical protein
VSVQVAELPRWQRFLPGSTAWRISYGRRQVVEGANGILRGGFVNIAHKFFRVFGLTKMRILLAATIVGFNLWRIGSFMVKKAKEAADAESALALEAQEGTWAEVIPARSATGPDPPPA